MNTKMHNGLTIPVDASEAEYKLSATVRDTILKFVSHYYAVPGRYYHDFNHIEQMLGRHKEYFGSDATDKLFFAIAAHDLIWIAGQSPRSEEMSAALVPYIYFMTVGEKISMSFNDEVNQLIRWTIAGTHLKDNRKQLIAGSDAERILDLDLSSMASPWQHFVQNQYAIDKEFIHLSTAEERRYGGAMFLNNFAKKGFVYYSESMRHLNPQAIQNIKAYVACIDQKLDRTWDDIAMSDPLMLQKLYKP